jgi:transcriptional regulator with XRE-family HTH domain
MDTTSDIAEFLTSRRAKITPEQAGLPTYGTRRVPGLRREKVASLAGVSIDYYKRLERGNVTGVSDGVLEALAGALQLDDAERAHRFDLARAANPAMPRRRRPVQQRVRPVIQRILDSIGTPALVRNARVDHLAANHLGRALYARCSRAASSRPTARFTFLDPAACGFYPDWERVATDLVARLRSEARRNPYDRGRPTSSASFRRAAANSARAGRRTTSATTGRAPSGSITRSSPTSTSRTRRWTSRPTPG